jgi:hypothetical protein
VKGIAMQKFLPLLALLLLVGCSVDPGTKADPVDITGKVTQGGKPVSGVVLNLQVVGTGSPAEIPLTGSPFKFKATPGKYTWYLSESRNAAAFKAIPARYRAGAMDRTVDITAGTTLDLKVE